MEFKSKYEVKFKSYRNQHLYSVDGENWYPSVTKIIGIIDKSGPLIYWARREALKLAKEELLKAIKNGLPIDEAHLDEVLARADRQPDKLKDEAADIGTRIHNAIDEFICGKEPTLDADAKPGYDNFRAWLDKSGIKIIQGDTPVASVAYGFGGRLDAIGERDGKMVVLDWKTSNSFKGRETYALQVAAYAKACEETFGVEIAEGHIVRFGKTEPGDVEVKDVILAPAWKAFTDALFLSKNMKMEVWK